MFKSRLGYEVLIAAILGIFAGLFLGPICEIFQPVGTGFVMLIQMVVLPYIPTLLIHGLGSLTPEIARKLLKRGWYFLIMLWGLMFGAIYILKILIPTPLPQASADFTEEPTRVAKDFLSYIIPENPFYDLANNVVPAIALFSVVIGVALMHLKDKEPVLGFLEKVNLSLDKVFHWIALISPIGIFAHIANVVGTVNFNDLVKLEVYVVSTILACLFLSMWFLPNLVSCFTSIPYKDLRQEFRIVTTIAFATGIPSIAFPYINNCMRRLAERNHLDLGTFRGTAQTVVPLAFSFAQIGNFFLLLFIFFLAFFYRHPLTDTSALLSPILTIPISFGTPQLSLVGMSFLIDALRLPAEAFNLFVETLSMTLNFQVLLSVASMLTLTILVILHYYGLLQIQWRRLLTHVGSSAAILLAAVFIGKQFVNISDNYSDLYYTFRVSDVISDPPQVAVYTQRDNRPVDKTAEPLARIFKTRELRVGYDPTNIPFCYLNKWNEVVGYDIAFAYELAKDLEAKLTLVPLDLYHLAEDLDNGYFDMAMSAIVVDEERLLTMDFSHAYIDQPNALIVPANKVDKFRDLGVIEHNPNLKIGAEGAYRMAVSRHFSPQILVPVTSIQPLYDNAIDAYMWSQLPGYLWCLSHPEYTTLSYSGDLGSKYFAYPVRTGAIDMIQFINQWMTLKDQRGFTKLQSDYWIQGKRLPPKEPRWSIIRDVLHWVK
ncbi:MAG: cation:dicarboxylase symporter family transporter [Verrucomicrobia bacterium]|nr:cation:dicarboxylase symporter family transporter [Verrucomicrobiota bacterium]